ncbi:MAG: sensor histidine kinase [Chitinophagaceae bacterium]
MNAQRVDQARKVDSLMKLLAAPGPDTGKVMVMLTLSSWYETNNQDSSAYYLKKGRELSESLKFDKGIYFAYQQGAVLAYTKGNYTESLEQSEKGLVMARKLKDSSKVVAMLNNLGIVNSYFGNFEKQLEYTIQIKTIIEEMKDSSLYSGLWHNLANCYFNLGQYRKGADAALYALYIEKFVSKKNGYINRVYATLGQCYDGLRMNDSALLIYDISIRESQKRNDKYAEGTIYGYKCNLLAGMKRFGEMLTAADQSLKLSKELQSRQMLASSLYNMAYAELFNNNNNEAYKNIKEALSIALADTLKDELKNCYTVLSYIAAREGNFEESITAKQKADSITDASLNEKVLNSTAELERKYESEKKDSRIKLQEVAIQRKGLLNKILIGSAVALLTVILLLFRNHRQKQKLQQQRISELETEKKLTVTEGVLKGEEQERTRLAKDLHDGLGGMLSGIKYSLNTMKGNLIMTPENQQAFERSMDMLDSSIKEMRRVAHNMMPEALVKFGLDTALRDFCNDINQSGALQVSYQSIGLPDAAIDQTTGITIYRIVQELINNTMKHAAARKAIVQVTRQQQQLTVTVEDDGRGFDTAILRGAEGIGWNNIKNRVEFLKGKLDIDSQPGKGTSVHIEFET